MYGDAAIALGAIVLVPVLAPGDEHDDLACTSPEHQSPEPEVVIAGGDPLEAVVTINPAANDLQPDPVADARSVVLFVKAIE